MKQVATRCDAFHKQASSLLVLRPCVISAAAVSARDEMLSLFSFFLQITYLVVHLQLRELITRFTSWLQCAKLVNNLI